MNLFSIWLACGMAAWLALAGLAGAAPAPPEGKAPPELLKAQRDAAQKAYKACAALYDNGTAIDAEKCYLWSRRWLEAERQLAGDGDTYRAAVAEHLDRMKKLEEAARQLFEAGRGSALDVAGAAFYRAEAETWVAQAKGK
jgi:hypothetical protein